MQELIQYVVDQFAENKDEVEIITEEKERGRGYIGLGRKSFYGII